MEDIVCKIQSMDSDLSEKFIIAACDDSMLRLFSVKNNSMKFLTQLSGHSGVATQALFVHQGELIVSSDFEGKLIVWKLENTTFVKKAEIKVANGPIYDIAVRYLDGALTVFCGCDNGSLKTVLLDSNLKHTISEQEVHRFGIISVACNSNYVITGGTDCSVTLIKNEKIEHFRHHSSAVIAVAILPHVDDQRIIFASGSEDGKLVLIKKNLKDISKQEIDLGAPCYCLNWNKCGFVLTVGYGEGNFKSFILGEDDQLEEVPMETLNN